MTRGLFSVQLLVAAVVVWFYVFSGVYRIGSVPVYPAFLIALLGMLFYFRPLFFHIRALFIFAFVFVGLTLLSQFSSGFDSDMFFYLFRYVVKSLLLPLFGAFFVFRVLSRFELSSCAKILVLVLSLQLLLIVLQLVSVSFRSFFFSHLQLADNWQALADAGHFRATGLAGLSIYDTSISYALIMLALGGLKGKDRWWLGLGLIFGLVLSLIAGRTGFLLSLVFVVCIFMKSRRKFLWVLWGSGIIALGLLITIQIIEFETLYLFSRFVFEPVYAFIETGRFSSASTSQLVDDYLFVPWDVNPILGVGFWAQPSLSRQFGFDYQTDSGFILCFIAFGVSGLVFCAVYLIWLYKVLLDVIEEWMGLGLGSYLCWVAMCVLLFFLMLKAPFFMSERIVPAILTVMIIYFIGRRSVAIT